MPLWKRDYVYADGGLVAEVRNVDSSEDPIHHFHADHLGSTRLTTAGNTGVFTRAHDYWPFGEEITSTVQTSFEDVQPMKFTGHERDYISAVNTESTDYLDYMHARYYAPTLGRFLSVDPGKDWAPGQPQSWNMYAYVRNNPVNRTDPTGRCSAASGTLVLCMQLVQMAAEAFYDTAANSGIGKIIRGAQTGDTHLAQEGQLQLDHEVITGILVGGMTPSKTRPLSVPLNKEKRGPHPKQHTLVRRMAKSSLLVRQRDSLLPRTLPREWRIRRQVAQS